MTERVSNGSAPPGGSYGWAMKTKIPVAPRTATIERKGAWSEGQATHHRAALATAAAGVILAMALAACAPGPSNNPSVALPSVSVPSVDVSAAASVASQAALAALDQIDTAITANQTSAGLTADDASSLKQLTAGIRTSLQTGDTTAARTAVDNLSTKVDALAAKLNTDAGKLLKDAITALKAALPAS